MGLSSFDVMEWTREHRTFVVEHFFRTGSVTAALRKFRIHFHLKCSVALPSRSSVYGWIYKFQTSGSVARKARVKTPNKVRTPENIGAVKQSVNQSPVRSARKHALALGLSSRTVRRILHYDLKMQFVVFNCVKSWQILFEEFQNAVYETIYVL